MDNIATEKNLSVFFTGSSGCPPFIGVVPNRPDQRTNNCKALNDRVLNYAREQQVNGIILSARWSYYIDGNYDGSGAQLIARSSDGPFTRENSIKAFNQSFLETVNEYKGSNIPIYLMSQPPQQVSSPESLYFRAARALAVFMTCQLLEKSLKSWKEYQLKYLNLLKTKSISIILLIHSVKTKNV